ncbi:hypothetical protein N7457_007362 [Penicillium paradoxum]|uniref:uncharacterized protein n=1 Tax=Penicillium paradoxum TaxID=176176 RepID=UPI00254805A1|nr:uncharacterized protein N7457_007362 [Penicillium paradoxum]KAJ5779642.1 hypothetical protein N7457_007362 [Penicillium paradoxum]
MPPRRQTYYMNMGKSFMPRFWGPLGLWNPEDPSIVAAQDMVLAHLHTAHDDIQDRWIEEGLDPSTLLKSRVKKAELKTRFIEASAQLPPAVRSLDPQIAADYLWDLYSYYRHHEPLNWGLGGPPIGPFQAKQWRPLGLWNPTNDPTIRAAQDMVLAHIHTVHDRVLGGWVSSGREPRFFLVTLDNLLALKSGFIDPAAQLPQSIRDLQPDEASEAMYVLYRNIRDRNPREWGVNHTERLAPQFWAPLGLANPNNDPAIAADQAMVMTHLHTVHDRFHGPWVSLGNTLPSFLIARANQDKLKAGLVDSAAQLPASVRNLDPEAASTALFELYHFYRQYEPLDWGLPPGKQPSMPRLLKMHKAAVSKEGGGGGPEAPAVPEVEMGEAEEEAEEAAVRKYIGGWLQEHP